MRCGPDVGGVTSERELRVAGKIVRFYTLRAQSLLRDRYLKQFSWHWFTPIRKKYVDLAFLVICKSPEGC
jgi:hypothetical protein